ncbi:MAG: hypothetical protein Q8O34_16665 [Rhodocyclaceae bacterium]|nr:hypothetical protein [Rhodocyclaceae bacterium]
MPIYTDAHLSRLATLEREMRAEADVDAITTFPAFWREKLVTLRVYLLICQESLTGNPEDTFQAKLDAYRKKWAATLPLALDAARAAGATPPATLPALSATFGR